ncbi:MAG: Gfo/Idh/MocA family protein [Niabella sp.]
MDTKVNFAISGCGNIAARHALAATTYGKLAAVCDNDYQKASVLANQFHCKAYSTLSEMLYKEKDIDVVSICTPNYLHAPQSITCLEADKHVLCEKPMAITVTDAKAMVAAAQQAQKELFIVKQLRYYPGLFYIRELIQNGQLGKIYSFHINCFWNRPPSYYKEWKGNKEKDGGTLFTQFSHYIDAIIWLFGYPQKENILKANLAHPQVDFEDVGIVNFLMPNGSIGNLTYTVNAYNKNVENSIAVFAENGSLKLSGAMLNRFEYFSIKNIDQIPDLFTTNTLKDQSHFAVYENLVNAIGGKKHSILKAAESITSIELIERIYNNHNH